MINARTSADSSVVGSFCAYFLYEYGVAALLAIISRREGDATQRLLKELNLGKRNSDKR